MRGTEAKTDQHGFAENYCQRGAGAYKTSPEPRNDRSRIRYCQRSHVDVSAMQEQTGGEKRLTANWAGQSLALLSRPSWPDLMEKSLQGEVALGVS